MSRVLLVSSLASLLPASMATADWPAGGAKIGQLEARHGFRNVAFADLASGDLSVIGLALDGTSHPYLAQRVLRTGGIAPGWPAIGTPFTPITMGDPRRSFFVDADGFAWHAFRVGTRVTAQYIDSLGVLDPAAQYAQTESSPATAPDRLIADAAPTAACSWGTGTVVRRRRSASPRGARFHSASTRGSHPAARRRGNPDPASEAATGRVFRGLHRLEALPGPRHDSLAPQSLRGGIARW